MKWHNARQVWAERPDRELHNARKKADPERHAARLRKWRAENPEAQKEIERRQRAKDGPKLKLRNAQWRAENLDYARERSRQYHAQNRDTANSERKKRDHRTKETSPWIRCLAAREKKARWKKLPFELTDEWARTRWNGCCELTGIPFSTANRYGNFFSPSIDRIDAAKGYTKENSRFILFAVNAFKGTGSDEDMRRVTAALHAYYCQLEPCKL